MAYTYDAFGNYVDQDEEERKRKEAEEAARIQQLNQSGMMLEAGLQPSGAETFPVAPPADVEEKPLSDIVATKNETVTYADGSKTEKTTREIPAASKPAETVTPVEPVKPVSLQTAQPQQEAGAGRGFVNPARVQPQNAYNQRIAQMESGNDDTIGFHAPGQSTAYGKYGITDVAWKTAQQTNPALAGVKKTEATPEQMEMAMDTVTQNNSKFLKNYGVPVNENTLAAAHFIGAKGLANYLRDGSISEGAARANGGYDKTRAIIEARLNGQPALASGAQTRSMQQQGAGAGQSTPQFAQNDPRRTDQGLSPLKPVDVAVQPVPEVVVGGEQPQTQPVQQPVQQPAGQTPTQKYIDQYQTAQDDPMKLLAMRNDKEAPQFLRERAAARAADILNQQVKTQRAEQQVQKMVATGDTAGIAKVVAAKGSKDEFKSIMRSMFLRMMGANKAADEELANIGYGNTSTIGVNKDGKQAMIEKDVTGRIIGGTTADGEHLSATDAIAYAAGVNKTKPDVSLQDVQKGNMAGRVVTTYDSNNRPTTMVESGGKMYPYDASWKPRSISTALEKAAGQEAIKLQFAGPIAYTKEGAGYIGKFNAENGTNLGYNTQLPGAPLVDMNTGAVVTQNSDGSINATRGTPGQAIGTQPQAPVKQPVAPETKKPETVKQPVAPTQIQQAPAKVTPATAVELPHQPQFRETGFENESPAAFQARVKAWSDNYAKTSAKEQLKMTNAQDLYNVAKDINDLLPQATGSWIGHKIDQLAGVFGASTEGAKAIAKLQVLGTKILMNVPRFEGPQSDKDTAVYKEAAGKLSDPETPTETRIAAFRTIMDINKKYAPDLNWNFETPLSETDKKALEWAKKHPDDERAKNIRKQLGR